MTVVSPQVSPGSPSSPTGRRRWVWPALNALPLLFLALFYLYPLVAILHLSLFGAQGIEWGAIGESLRQPYLWQTIAFTVGQALLSTALTLLLGLPLAYLFTMFDFPGKGLFQALLTLPFVMPAIVVAPGFLVLLGENGIVVRRLAELAGVPAADLALPPLVLVLLAHVFYNLGIVIRTVGGFWSRLNPHLREAANTLGASGRRTLLEVTLPLLAPSIAAAALLVFLFCFTSFGIILLLGGSRLATLEVEIYRQTVVFFNLPLAAVLSMLQMVITFGVMWLYTRVQARTALALRQSPRRESAAARATPLQRLFLSLAMLAVVAMILAPLVAVAARSFGLGGEGPTLRYYLALGENPRNSAFFQPPIRAVTNSLLFALAAAAISLPLGVISAYMLVRPRHWWQQLLDTALLLPLNTSAVTLAFGYVISMGPLRATPWLVPIAHSLIALPFVVRTFLPALRALDQRLREAAAMLGASPSQIWRTVDLPILARPFLISAVFVLAISLGEFSATLLISRPETPTMPMVIYRALGQAGQLNYGQAMAMSTILMVVTTVILFAMGRLRFADVGEF